MPLFSYSGNIYKALADTVFIGSIPYKTATGELIIFNSTKDTAGVLYNNGSGVTQFKKVRSIKLNDSTYVIKIGTSVIGDTIKILSSASSGGTVTDFTFTDGNGFDGTVTNSTTTPTLVLVADTLTKFASVMRLLDSITAINARVASKGSGTVTNVGSGYGTNFSAITSTGSIIVDSTVIGTKTYINTKFAQTAVGTVTSVATDNTLTGGTITSTGTLKVDTSRISTKGNVTGLLLNKQDNLISGTTIKTINSTSLLGSGNITTPDAQTLSTSYGSDSITLSISGGNSIKFAYAVDSVGMVSTDSLITYKAGVRRSYKVGSTGGGGALSAITAATATNTIDNKAYQQTWKWDSLSSGTGMKISTASTLASGNTQTLFEIEQTGTNATSSLKTYATKIKSTKSSNSNSNVALYLEASGVSLGGASNSRALEIGGGEIYINTGGTTNPYFRFASGAYWFDNTVGLQYFNAPAGTNTGFSFAPNSVYGINFQNHFSGTAGFGFSNYSSTRNAMLFGAQGYFASYYAQQASAVVLERDKDVFSISADSATGSTFFTPTKILSVRGKTTNVGIGTQLPDASAILDLTSTTKGFLPPRMTSTQGSALTPIEGLLIYVTDTNGTFTSKGWWGYNGSAWEKLNN